MAEPPKFTVTETGRIRLPNDFRAFKVKLIAAGGGGAGGNEAGTHFGAGGGGAGGETLTYDWHDAVPPILDFHVGVGGAGGVGGPGGDGGDTWIGEKAFIRALGGPGGTIAGPPHFSEGGISGFSDPIEGVAEFYAGDGGTGSDDQLENGGGGGGGVFKGDYSAMYGHSYGAFGAGGAGGNPVGEGHGGKGASSGLANAEAGTAPGAGGGGGSYKLRPEAPILPALNLTCSFTGVPAPGSHTMDQVLVADLFAGVDFGIHNKIQRVTFDCVHMDRHGLNPLWAFIEFQRPAPHLTTITYQDGPAGPSPVFHPYTTEPWRLRVYGGNPDIYDSYFQWHGHYWCEDIWGNISNHATITITFV